MQSSSVPAVVMAGVAVQLGVYHLAVFSRSRERRRDLTFALVCFAGAAYGAFSAALYEVDAVGGGGPYQRGQLATAALGFGLLVRFVAQLAGGPSPRWTRALSNVYFVIALVTAFERVGLTVTDVPATKLVHGLIGGHVVYHEVQLGPAGLAVALLTPLLVAAMASLVRAIHRRGDRRLAITLGASMTVLMAGVVNDSLVGLGWLSNVYLFEYAFVALVVLVALELSNEVFRAAETAGALAESESRLRTILDAIADAVVAVDATGTIARMNPAAEALTGWPLREAEGRALGEVVRLLPDAARGGGDASKSTPLARLAADDAALDVRLLLDRAGQEKLVTRAEAPLLSRDGLPLGAVLVLRDVTQQRVLEARVHEAERMESIGRIAGGVAHDFNNLLTPILGYADVALRRAPEQSAGRESFRFIYEAAKRASELTRQLLAFGGRQILEVRTLDLNAAIETILPLLRKVIREDVRIETHLADGLGAVRVDPSQLEQILMNLAVNARDAMPEGGVLTFETAEVDLMEDARGGHPKGRYVALVVRDTGTGMDSETRRHVFEPFYTTKERGRGTGLGLATVHGIVQQHGGRVEVDSAPRRGTAFRIYLPRVEATLEPEAPNEEPPPVRGGREAVLVVDDDQAVRQFAADVLAEHGYEVLVAADGAEAVEVADRREGPLHAVLTDVIMPGIDGRKVCDQVRDRYPEVACVLMSGYAEQALGDRASILEKGVFLQKPFTAAQLLARLRVALEESPAADRVAGPT